MEDITLGKDQKIRIEIMKDIQEGKNPFEILFKTIEYIGKISGEKSFATVAKDNIKSVYGIALGEPVLLEEELKEVIKRGKLLKAAYEREGEEEDNKIRINYAIIAHRKRAEQLQEMIKANKNL